MNDRNNSQSLSVGDAIAIVAFLLFICAWVAGWVFIPHWSRVSNASNGVALFFLALMFGPPLWAGVMLTRLIQRPRSEDDLHPDDPVERLRRRSKRFPDR